MQFMWVETKMRSRLLWKVLKPNEVSAKLLEKIAWNLQQQSYMLVFFHSAVTASSGKIWNYIVPSRFVSVATIDNNIP